MSDRFKHLGRWAVCAAILMSPWMLRGVADRWVQRPAAATRLRVAAMAGDLYGVSQELSEGADVNATDYEGDTALKCAAVAGHELVVERLLDAKANIDAADLWGRTALMDAASSDRDDVVRRLLMHGASTTLRDHEGHTALDLAEMHDATKAIAALTGGRAAEAGDVGG